MFMKTIKHFVVVILISLFISSLLMTISAEDNHDHVHFDEDDFITDDFDEFQTEEHYVDMDYYVPTDEIDALNPDSFSAAVTWDDVTSIAEQYYNAVTSNGAKTVYWNAGIRREVTGRDPTTQMKTTDFIDTITYSGCLASTTSGVDHLYPYCYSNGFNGVGTVDASASATSAVFKKNTDFQCSGFAAYMEYVLFRTTDWNQFKLCYGTGSSSLANLAGDIIKPGDQLRYNGHSYVIYKVDSSKAYFIQCNTKSKDCKITRGSEAIEDIKTKVRNSNGTTTGLLSSPAVQQVQKTTYCYNNYSGKNYFPNTDFNSLSSDEYDSRDTTVATLSIDSTNKHNGYNSLKITNSKEGSSSNGQDLAFITTTQGKNGGSEDYVGDTKEMVMSFWAKSSVSGSKMYFRWGYEGSYRNVTLSKDWTKYTVSMNKTASSCNNWIHPYVDTAGIVWISELQLEDGTSPTEFVPEKGGLYQETNQIVGSSFVLPSGPSRTGCTFNGWYTDARGGTEITNSTTVPDGKFCIYAHWTGNYYTVSFDTNGGFVSTSTKTVSYGSTYGTLPIPTRTGYAFDGWYTAPNGGTRIYETTTVTITSNQTLYARWVAINYTVTFDANGGSVSPVSKSVTFGLAYGSLPTPVWNDHDFDGWFTAASGGTQVTSTTTVTQAANHTLYAHWTETVPSLNVTRISHSDIQQESIKVASELKEKLGINRFNNVVIATDAGFADALSGSYLAVRKNAPILYVGTGSYDLIYDYLERSLISTGTIYILGDANAVPKRFEDGLRSSYKTVRLAGSSRYLTNLAILKEAGMTYSGDIIVVTGSGFADSLSAGALGLPIIMVNNKDTKLKKSQREFMEENVLGKVYILGDENAVNSSLEIALKAYGPVTRIGGTTRWETTRMIAQKFRTSANNIVISYGLDFKDGLIASPLAYALNAPLVLASSNKTYQAKLYVQKQNLSSAYVVGPAEWISDEAIGKIFDNYSVVITEQ